MNFNLKDTVIVQLYNGLGNESTALHFHGQNQVNRHSWKVQQEFPNVLFRQECL